MSNSPLNPKKYAVYLCICTVFSLRKAVSSITSFTKHVFLFPVTSSVVSFWLLTTDAPCCWTVHGQSRFSWLYLFWHWVQTANLRTPLGSSCPSKVREHFSAFSWCAPGFHTASFVWPVVLGEPCEREHFGICFSHLLLVFMTEFDELIYVLRSAGNSLRRLILPSNHTVNEWKPSVRF